MKKKKNKYADIEMIDLENKVDDIEYIYINCLFNIDKTVGLIANKEIAEYILDTIIKFDETSVKEISLVDYMNIDEYLLSVDDDGYITCVPIEDYGVLDNTDIFYIDMDGSIKQDIIDYCVNEDKEVILFGQEDDCDDDCENCACADELSASIPSTTYKVNGKEVSEDEYISKLKDTLDDLSDWVDIASSMMNVDRVINNRLNRLRKIDDLLV